MGSKCCGERETAQAQRLLTWDKTGGLVDSRGVNQGLSERDVATKAVVEREELASGTEGGLKGPGGQGMEKTVNASSTQEGRAKVCTQAPGAGWREAGKAGVLRVTGTEKYRSREHTPRKV